MSNNFQLLESVKESKEPESVLFTDKNTYKLNLKKISE